jgi:hypothetical protein
MSSKVACSANSNKLNVAVDDENDDDNNDDDDDDVDDDARDSFLYRTIAT